jgi:hypothetical protein
MSEEVDFVDAPDHAFEGHGAASELIMMPEIASMVERYAVADAAASARASRRAAVAGGSGGSP